MPSPPALPAHAESSLSRVIATLVNPAVSLVKLIGVSDSEIDPCRGKLRTFFNENIFNFHDFNPVPSDQEELNITCAVFHRIVRIAGPLFNSEGDYADDSDPGTSELQGRIIWIISSEFMPGRFDPFWVENIHYMSKYASGLLWRLVTAHNYPPDPIGHILDLGRIRDSYMIVLESEEFNTTPKTKCLIDHIKFKLRAYFFFNADLDEPDEKMCEWLELADADDTEEEME
jgi:hypothetical protein